MGRQKHKRWRRYLLTTGLSLICMVLSSWLFVLGRLKLLFFLWRREQHEPSPWGEEDREDAREPDLFINEISKQFDWNVCSSTNSWFCRGGEREREKEDMLLMNHRISSGFTGLSKQQAKIFDGVEKKHRLKHNSRHLKYMEPAVYIRCHLWKYLEVLSLWQMNKTWSQSMCVGDLPVGGGVTPRYSGTFPGSCILSHVISFALHLFMYNARHQCKYVHCHLKEVFIRPFLTDWQTFYWVYLQARILIYRECVCRAASTELLSEPGIKEALTSMNYR